MANGCPLLFYSNIPKKSVQLTGTNGANTTIDRTGFELVSLISRNVTDSIQKLNNSE